MRRDQKAPNGKHFYEWQRYLVEHKLSQWQKDLLTAIDYDWNAEPYKRTKASFDAYIAAFEHHKEATGVRLFCLRGFCLCDVCLEQLLSPLVPHQSNLVSHNVVVNGLKLGKWVQDHRYRTDPESELGKRLTAVDFPWKPYNESHFDDLGETPAEIHDNILDQARPDFLAGFFTEEELADKDPTLRLAFAKVLQNPDYRFRKECFYIGYTRMGYDSDESLRWLCLAPDTTPFKKKNGDDITIWEARNVYGFDVEFVFARFSEHGTAARLVENGLQGEIDELPHGTVGWRVARNGGYYPNRPGVHKVFIARSSKVWSFVDNSDAGEFELVYVPPQRRNL